MPNINQIDREKLPSHVAVIMDGNGRWAKQKGEERIFGHQNAVSAVKDTVEVSAELGVQYLTLYAFSTENWNRPQEEVNSIMELLISTIHSELETLQKNNISLNMIGDLESLPLKSQDKLNEAIKLTSSNSGLNLILALSYSGKWDLTQAVNKLLADSKNKEFDSVSEEVISSYLSTKNIPDPELLIRTSGEKRISNFLLWQLAYTELYFCDTLWPDFNKEEYFKAIISYQSRERRFGKTSEQLTT